MRGSRTAICRISLRFFSPPEKPTFTGRFSMSASIFNVLCLLADELEEIGRAHFVLVPAPCFWALSAVRRKVMLPTPGISTGYWNARKRPSRGAFLGIHIENDPRRPASRCPSVTS